MKYIEVSFTLNPVEPYRDILIDALGNEGPYDSFVETPDGLKAYVPTDQFNPAWLQDQISVLQQFSTFNFQLSTQEMPDKNWNEEWEKQHHPVLVEAANSSKVWVRAPFHDHRADADYEIEIEPKMSFGTAHHPTTYMMLSYVAELDMLSKNVLDMGCGTGTLLDVGRGKLTLDDLQEIIERKDRCAAGVSMPPQGLFLTKVEYPENIFIS